ncbi:manganese efflux pump [Bacillus massiliigorillae]|uniref:manganese efflux pump n=1 Tax=Bacillus massiliigorillae TaxID=1243664 RepID=UPI0003AB1B13|nr:manganese efflux pump [Bacillus massiliigorillae]
MHIITIILVGLAANLDNLGIGLAYGIKKTKIPLLSNIVIAVISMIVTYIAVITGNTITHYISTTTANLLGSILLCIIGIWTILAPVFSKPTPFENPEYIDWDQNQIISAKEAIYLGFTLSLNCLATGIAIGANNISPLWTVVSIGLFSLITIGIGSKFGYILAKTVFGKHSTTISGVFLILIGLYEIFV